MTMKEEVKAVSLITATWFWIVLLVVGAGAVFYFVQPYFIAKETATIRQSNAYITSRQTALITLKADYDRLEVRRVALDDTKDAELKLAIASQQIGIVRQMQQEASLIPGRVPQDVQIFLSGR